MYSKVLGVFPQVYMLVECLQKWNISTEHSVRIAMTATLICRKYNEFKPVLEDTE